MRGAILRSVILSIGTMTLSVTPAANVRGQSFVVPQEKPAAANSAQDSPAPAASAPAQSPDKASSRPRLEPVYFNGVQLGTSTPEDVAAAWGQPLKEQQQDTVVQRTYELEPFERVEVTFHQNRALALVIHLRERFAPQALAEQLELAEIDPVALADSAGEAVGQAYPERGVTLSFEPGTKPAEVARIVLEELDARLFLLRAEARSKSNFTGCLADLNFALELDPKSARALWFKARVLYELARLHEAMDAAEKALALEPSNPEYQLTRARLLADQEQYAAAIEATEQAIGASAQRPEVKARGVCQLGDLIAHGPQHDLKLALDYHMQAIKLAEPMLYDPRAAVRRAARETLIDAHLASAVDIAHGFWKTRQTAVPKWLERARALATDASLGAGDRDRELIKICSCTLDASAGLEGQLDPTLAVDVLLDTIDAQLAAADDPLFKQYLELQLGRGLIDGVQAYHLRGDPASARKCGSMAATTLAHLWDGQQPPPAEAYRLARLHFRLGAMCAIEDHDHKQAVAWFDKAAALEQAAPASAAIDLGRQGESLVSMAVSYWAVGQQERALQLTRAGAEWMEQAVKEGSLNKQALTVPYSNLAAMHRHLGHGDKARGFEEMAGRTSAPQRR